MMFNSVYLFDTLSALLFFVSFVILAQLRTWNGSVNKNLLMAAILILFGLAMANLLEQSGVLPNFYMYEDFIEIILYPIFIFGIYSSLISTELNRRKESEREVAEQAELLEKIFQSIPILLMQFNRQTKTIKVNHEFRKKIGFTSEELEGNNLIELFIRSKKEQIRARIASGNFGGSWEEFPITIKSGEVRRQKWARIALSDQISIGVGLDVEDLRVMERELNREQRRFELISKSTNDVLYDWDLVNDEVWWSRGWQTHLGFSKEEIGFDKEWMDSIIHPEDLTMVNSKFEHAMNSATNQWSETYRIISADKTVFHVEDKGFFVRNKRGEAVGIVGALQNVTDRMEMIKAIKESEEKYKLLFDKSPLSNVIYDPVSLKIEEINESATKIYGYSNNEAKKLSILDLFIPEDHENVKYLINKYEGHTSEVLEWKHLTKSGKVIYVEIKGSVISYLGKALRIAIIKDITSQKEAEEQVMRSFVEGENEERIRLAKELHDGLGQYLAAANMNFDALSNSVEFLGERELKLYNNGIEYLQHAMKDTRQISHDLMPGIVQDKGLVEAVKSLAETVSSSGKIKVQFINNAGKLDLTKKRVLNVYRIIQESITNIIKHAEASEASIQFAKDDYDFFITIEDNGKGFDASAPSYDPGLGLNSIKTRVFVLGGVLDIDTAIDKGTILTVSIPI